MAQSLSRRQGEWRIVCAMSYHVSRISYERRDTQCHAHALNNFVVTSRDTLKYIIFKHIDSLTGTRNRLTKNNTVTHNSDNQHHASQYDSYQHVEQESSQRHSSRAHNFRSLCMLVRRKSCTNNAIKLSTNRRSSFI